MSDPLDLSLLASGWRLDDRPVSVAPRVRVLRGARRVFDPGIDLV